MIKLFQFIFISSLLFLFSCEQDRLKNSSSNELTTLNELDSVLWVRILKNPDSVYLHLDGIEMLISGEFESNYFSPRKISGKTDTYTFSIDDLYGIWEENSGYFFVFYEDIDFDGFKDLGILNTYGATGNYWYKFWIYDKNENNLIYNQQYSDRSSPLFDLKNQTMLTYYRAGYCEEAISILKNGKLIKQIYTERENTKAGPNCWCIIQEKIDSIWKETERKIISQPLDKIYRKEMNVIYGEQD